MADYKIKNSGNQVANAPKMQAPTKGKKVVKTGTDLRK